MKKAMEMKAFDVYERKYLEQSCIFEQLGIIRENIFLKSSENKRYVFTLKMSFCDEKQFLNLYIMTIFAIFCKTY